MFSRRTRPLFFLLLLSLTSSALAQQNPQAVADAYLAANSGRFGLTAADIADRAVSDSYRSRSSGATHVYYVQRHQGIEVYNGLLNLTVTPDGSVLSSRTNGFLPNLAQRINTTAPLVPPEMAVLRAAEHLGISAGSLRIKQVIGGPDRETVYFGDAVSRMDIPVKLMFLGSRTGAVRLTWDLRIQPDSNHVWQIKVDAVTAQIPHQLNLVQQDSYRVFASPAESPNHVAGGPFPPADGRTLVTESAVNTTASPSGWHTGFSTSGNNVSAQSDTDGNDVPDLPQPTSPTRDFDYPVDFTQHPSTYLNAAITNLFYWNNIIHDTLYLYGFDEVSGNFQAINHTLQGLGEDPVLADAQDGSGTNNANFLTLPDGAPPRMQMFIWTPSIGNKVIVNAPAGLGPYQASGAGFGPALDEVGVTGDVVLVNDGVGDTNDACEPIQNTAEISGKIALINRGTCTFIMKVQRANDAGAIAAILTNNQGDNNETAVMGGDEPHTITIPSQMIGRGHGDELRANLPAPGVNVTMVDEGGSIPRRDSDLDNLVITHEYGHGVSNRLTGGPANTFCLGLDDQGGEGWSDYLGLVLTAQAVHTATTPRSVGSYLTYEDNPSTARGIRPFPYTTDMTVNPQTYGDLTEGQLSIPHGVGSVWATTLWDMYWALTGGVTELGLPVIGFRANLNDLTAPLAGNQVALQLVMDGMKLQPCDPSFLDARDAILQADDILYDGQHNCYIWWAFGRRGMGVNAFDDPDNGLNVVEDFSLPPACKPGTGCTLGPKFAGATHVTSGSDGTCQLTVHWNEATANCGNGSVSYSVYRSTASNFTPADSNRIASGLTGTSYTDTKVSSGVRYFYVVRAVDSLGNSDVNTARRSGVPGGELSAGSFFDDAGDTRPPQFTAVPGTNTWAIRDTGGFLDSPKVYATSAGGNYPDRSCLRLESDTIYLGPDPQLLFFTNWAIEPAWDGGIVEISTEAGQFNDWKKLETIVHPGVMGGPLGNTSCVNPGLRDGQTVFNGVSGDYVPIAGLLNSWADQAIRLRFVFGSDGATNDLGWFVDNISIDDTRQPSACQRAPEITCYEDDASQISYSNGWHRQNDPDASGGHFRLHLGKSSRANVRFDFTVTGESGAIVYHYATSTKGGTADVYVDGVFKGIINFNGAAVDARNPDFGSSFRVEDLVTGPHSFELRNLRDAAYVDKFCVENSESNASPGFGPGATSSGSSTLGVGAEWLQTITVPAGTTELSVAAGSTPQLPISLVVLNPLGSVVGVSDNSSGFAVVDTEVSQSGLYVVKVVNLSAGPVSVWTMATPLIRR